MTRRAGRRHCRPIHWRVIAGTKNFPQVSPAVACAGGAATVGTTLVDRARRDLYTGPAAGCSRPGFGGRSPHRVCGGSRPGRGSLTLWWWLRGRALVVRCGLRGARGICDRAMTAVAVRLPGHGKAGAPADPARDTRRRPLRAWWICIHAGRVVDPTLGEMERTIGPRLRRNAPPPKDGGCVFNCPWIGATRTNLSERDRREFGPLA